ncbi:RNA polymerase [Gordonia sp. HNM0687]|uniref:RNA polymerase n=1 Tax=Gordonia mangrovi TaxID=2665643 RepID=A0A6L7GLM6_9ACTN|nr:glycosyl hydrolase [Gordonia mangrovi]MXP20151.1 RNA polymerase [Gordonia mangrovi]UVF79241.1 glycoside hydrolase family protein [Gordonia mangrovi]
MTSDLTRRALLAGGLGLAAAGFGHSTASSQPQQLLRPPPPGPLPGVGLWQGPGVSTALANSGARWYYTWTPDHEGVATPAGCEFVPMIWGRRDLTDGALRRARSNGTVLLGFNEPDIATQADMTVDEALTAWPRLQRTGLRLGAPAVSADGHLPGGWLDRFMTGARARGLRVDFIPVHWYPGPWLRRPYSLPAALDDLRNYLYTVHRRYGRPLWLTEFSLITFQHTTSDAMAPPAQTDFLTAAAAMMTTIPFLERWAWFSLPPWPDEPETALYINGRPTMVGERFRMLS